METKVKWKKASDKVQTKQRFVKIIDNNLDQKLPIERVERFAMKRYIFISSDFDQYEQKCFSKKRMLIAGLYKVTMLLTGIRYFISAMSNEKWVTALMADSNYLLGNKKPISMLLSIASFIVLSIQVR